MTDDELILKLRELLKRCLPYIVRHFESSRTGFGNAARDLMNEVKSVLGIK